MVEYSFVSTVYNNANRLKICMDSLIKASANLDFEIVIVDNYSNDGSFEILRDYASLYGNIRVLRQKCSRGLGRQIAYKNSQGKYLITVDMDTEYLSKKLCDFLLAHKQSKLKDTYVLKTWESFCIYPRHAVDKVEGWRDYNIGEDMDILARLFLVNSVVFLPINLELNEPYSERQAVEAPFMMLQVFQREQRYAKGLNLISRTLRNRVDLYCSFDYTLRKLILRYKCLKIKIPKIFLAGTFMVLLKFINIFFRRRTTHADPDLNNGHYVFYMCIKNMIDPTQFRLETELGPIYLDEHFRFIASLKPDIVKGLQHLYAIDKKRKMQIFPHQITQVTNRLKS